MADEGSGTILFLEVEVYISVSGVQDVFGGRVTGIPLPGPEQEVAATSMGNTTGHTRPQAI